MYSRKSLSLSVIVFRRLIPSRSPLHPSTLDPIYRRFIRLQEGGGAKSSNLRPTHTHTHVRQGATTRKGIPGFIFNFLAAVEVLRVGKPQGSFTWHE